MATTITYSLPRGVTQKDIAIVVDMHLSLLRTALAKSIQIGEKLAKWKELVDHGSWSGWSKAMMPDIHQVSISRYIRIYENAKFLASHFKTTVKELSDGKTDVTLTEAEKAIREKVGNKARGKPPESKSIAPTSTNGNSNHEDKSPARLDQKPKEPAYNITLWEREVQEVVGKGLVYKKWDRGTMRKVLEGQINRILADKVAR